MCTHLPLLILKLIINGLILIGCQCFYPSSAGKNRSESDSKDIVSLCLHCCFYLLFFYIKERFSELYIYCYLYSYCPWCEQALNSLQTLLVPVVLDYNAFGKHKPGLDL